MCQVLYRGLWLTKVELNPPANVPGCREVAITEQCLFDQDSATVHVATKCGNRMCSLRQREGVIYAQLCCVAG